MTEIKSIHQIIEETIPHYKKKGGPETEHKLTYESFTESLEPVYYFILDLMNDFGLNVEKLGDNFSPTPGSSQFGDLGQRKSVMQQNASKILGDIGSLTRGVVRIVYDLRDFKTRLRQYDGVHSGDEKKRDAARLSLKQLWLDKVDIEKGNSSISMMARQLGFQTLFDAFFTIKKPEDADGLDLNERVKRIVKARINEFNEWINSSEKELRRRYSIQRNYLKSQVNNLKLYSKWAKPYLLAAQELEIKQDSKNPDLVKAFNRTLLELTLFGKSKVDLGSAAKSGELPKHFEKIGKKIGRDYYKCVLVDFSFRAVPTQGANVGTSRIVFRGYALNEDEIEKLNKEIEKSEDNDVIKLIEKTTGESLEGIEKDLEEFLKEDEKQNGDNEKSKKNTGTNPFMALIGGYNKKSKKSKDKKKKDQKEPSLKKETWEEKEYVRKLAVSNASDLAFNLFDIYKKAHQMPSYT